MRPGEPTRSTLENWLRQCRRCGAVAPNLARLSPQAACVVEGEAYRAAGPFLRWSMLCPPGERAEALLQAAWAADDAGHDARPLRLLAARAWGEPATPESALRLLDVLRRAGAFAEAERCAAEIPATDELAAQIVAFQRARIAAEDSGRHLLSSALRPPARTPHVAHGKRSPGFWQRLRGR